jgi:hypothetical protein
MQTRSCGGYDATSDGIDERLSNKLFNPEGGMLALPCAGPFTSDVYQFRRYLKDNESTIRPNPK